MKSVLPILFILFPFVLSAQVKIVLNNGDTLEVSNYKRDADFYTVTKVDGSSSRLPRDLVKAILRDYTGAKEVYCLIVGQAKLFSTDITVYIDYGQERDFWKRHKLEDEAGNARTFNSMVDALNFMSSKGWHFVDAYSITIGQQNVYHWLLKMEIDD